MEKTLPLMIGLIFMILAACSPQPNEINPQTVPEEPVILQNDGENTEAKPESEEQVVSQEDDENVEEDTEIEQPVGNGADADVEFVRAEWKDDGTWTFSVTVSHPDTGWEDYADGWDVVLPDGTVVKPDQSSPFTRLLAHPHENEQPFTRSQSGIVIPEDVSQVTVRAHDLVDGFGGQEVVVILDQATGQNFEVIRPGLETSNISLGLTHIQLDGNRILGGSLDFLNIQQRTIPVAGVPIWIVGIPSSNGGVLWLVEFWDGYFQTVELVNGEVKTNFLSGAVPSLDPPVFAQINSGEILNFRVGWELSRFSHPILTATGALAYINQDNQLVIETQERTIYSGVNALPDGRILSDGQGQLLVLSDPTTRYTHGVLGDSVEAGSVTLLDESGQILNKITIPNDRVVEGIMPIWADLDGDGVREIIVTVSDNESGARLVVYGEDGTQLASGTPIGTGFRWRHQLAVAPFGPNGEIELAVVLTPHLRATVEFFQMRGDRLEKVADVRGYTSHTIGSRNLDMALAADLDSDGQVELLLPNQTFDGLGIIKHTLDGAVVVGDLPLDGILTTNLAGVSLPDGSIAIAAGTDSGELIIWMP